MPVLQTDAPPLRRTLTVGTVARLTGYHPATIRRALAAGSLRGYRAGKRGMYRIPAEAVDEWIQPAHEDA